MRRAYCVASLIFFISLSGVDSLAQGTLKGNRDLTRGIAQGVHDLVKKNFYDPSLKGVDWDKELEKAQKKIDVSSGFGEMLAAIYWMVRKMDDSHTRFLPPWQTLEPRFGFQIKPFGDTVRVYKIKGKSSADKAGLLVGDTVLAIEGMVADRKSYWETQFFYRLIQPAGVMVVDIERNGQHQRLQIPANVHTRVAVQMSYDTSKLIDAIREEETSDAENPFQYASKDDIGYVKLPDFVGDRAEKALWKVKSSRALIIDVRGNPGGEVEDLLRFTSYLVKSETEIFTETSRTTTQKVTVKARQSSFSDIPIAVLVDSESASASEILARYLQLSGRAVIIGDKTAGDVAVARFLEQHIGADPTVYYGAQTTVGHLRFSDDKDIDKIGVTPDLMCIPEPADLIAKRDPCLGLAMSTLKAKLAGTRAQK